MLINNTSIRYLYTRLVKIISVKMGKIMMFIIYLNCESWEQLKRIQNIFSQGV